MTKPDPAVRATRVGPADKAEETLRQTHRKLDAVFDAIQGTICVVDLEYNLTDLNGAMLQAFGLPDKNALLGRKCYEVLKGAKTVCSHCAVAEAIRTNSPVCRTSSPEDRLLTAGRTFEIFAYPMTDDEGRVTGAVEFSRDVTERRATEESLQRSQAFLQTVIDAIPELTMVVDHDYRVVLANRAAREMAGKDADFSDLKCYQVSRHSTQSGRCDVETCPLKQVLATKAPVATVHSHFNAEGAEVVHEISAAPIFDERGEVIQILESCRDITARVRAEEALRRANRSTARFSRRPQV